MIIEKLAEQGFTIWINENNKLVIIPTGGNETQLTKNELNTLIHELNELAIKMK